MKKLISLGMLLAPFAIVTIIFGTIYGAVQQEQRSAANDPQIQIAKDIAESLNAGGKPDNLSGPRVAIDKQLDPFVMIFDQNSNLEASSGTLGGLTPTIPDGLLKNADHKPYYIVTWQPNGSTRIAAIVVKANSHYVLAGRNISEVEGGEEKTQLITGIGWALSMLIVALYLLVGPKFRTER